MCCFYEIVRSDNRAWKTANNNKTQNKKYPTSTQLQQNENNLSFHRYLY